MLASTFVLCSSNFGLIGAWWRHQAPIKPKFGLTQRFDASTWHDRVSIKGSFHVYQFWRQQLKLEGPFPSLTVKTGVLV